MDADPNLLIALFGAAIVLEHLVGVDLILGAAKKTDVAIRLAIAMLATGVICVVAGHLTLRWLNRADLGWLVLPVLIQIALLSVLTAGAAIYLCRPRLYFALRDYFPLLVSNALLIACVLFSQNGAAMADSMLLALAMIGGFSTLVVVVAFIEQRLATSDVPLAFRGAPIMLISLGILALGFMGFRH